MADPYGYDRPTLVDLTDNVNTFRRKVNQVSDDLGDKRRLLTDTGTSLASDSDLVGSLIELDYRLNQTSGDLYLRANGGSLYIQNGNTSTIAAEFLYDSAAGNLSLITPMSGDFTIDTVGDITLDADGNDIRFKNGGGGDEVIHTLADDANYTIAAPSDYIVDAVGDITLDVDGDDIYFKQAGSTKLTWNLGTDQEVDVSGNFIVDATGDIDLDADGGNVRIRDNEVTQFNFIAGTNKEIDVPSGDLTIDVAGDINLDADGGDVVILDGGVEDYRFATDGTVSRTGDLILDISGDITLDADGNDIIFKNGAGADTVTHTLADTGDYTITSPANYTVDTVGDITLDADGNDIIFKNGDGADTVTHTLANDANYTIAAPSDYIVDAVGDITLDADGNVIFFKDGSITRVQYNLGVNNSENWTGNLTRNVSVALIDSAGTSITNVSGTTTTHTVGTDYALTAGGNYTVDVDGSIADSAGTTIDRTAGTNITDTATTGSYSLTTGTTITQTSGGNFTTNVTGDIDIDASGNYTLDVVGSIADSATSISRVATTTINDTSGTTITQTVGSDYALTAGGNYTLDVIGSIRDSAESYTTISGGATSRTSGTATTDTVGTDYALTAGGNSTVDTTGSITEISGTTTTQTVGTDYALTAGGNYTTDVDGSIADSAGTTYSLVAGTSISQTSGTSISQTSGTTFTLTSGDDFSTNVTGDYIVEASGDIVFDVGGSEIAFNQAGDTKLNWNLGTNQEVEVSGDLVVDATGDIDLDAAGGNVRILQNAATQFDFISGINKEIDVPSGDLTIDVAGDIALDAAGQQINFLDATNTRMVFNLDATPQLDVTGDYTVTGSGSIVQSSTTTQELTGTDITLDASNNIYLEADGDQIHLRAITADKFIFGVATSPTLDITGNYTETGSGFHVTKSGTYMKDSAATNYTLTANTNILQTALNGSITETSGTTTTQTVGTDYALTAGGNYTVDVDGSITDSAGTTYSLVTGTSINQTSGTTFDQVSGGNFTTTVTGDYLVDASGDIILDADGNDIFFKDGSITRVKYYLSGNNAEDWTGNLTRNVSGSLIDSAGTSLKTVSKTTTTNTVGTDYALTAGGNYTVDVDGSIADSAGTTIDRTAGTTISDTAGTDYTVVAGTNISQTSTAGSTTHVSGTTTTHTVGTNYILTAGGNYTVDVDGSITDSADSLARVSTTITTDTVGTEYTLTAGNKVSITGDSVDIISGNVFTLTSAGDFTTNVTGDYLVDASGDITLDADGNDIIFANGQGADTVTHTLTDDGAYTITQSGSGDYTVDVGGDIILDADGGDVVILDGGVEDYRFATDGTISRSGNLVVDATGDITLDAAGDNIFFKDAGSTRITYTLGATTDIGLAGSLTTTVGGSTTENVTNSIERNAGSTILDSAGATHTIVAGTNLVQTATDGSYTLTTGTTIEETSGSTITRTGGLGISDVVSSGNYSLDAAAAIKDSAGTTHTIVAGTSINQTATTGFIQNVTGGNFTTNVTGNYLVDASGDITLDADGNDIIFKNGAGADVVTHTLADNADYTITAPDDVVIDADGDITLDANGNDIYLRDGASLRVQYNLGNNNAENWTGNLIRNVSGSLKDSAGTSIEIVSGTTFTQTSGGNFTTNVTGEYLVDASGDIILDADGSQVYIKNGGTERFRFELDVTPELVTTGGNFRLRNDTSDADILFIGNDDGSTITALTLDMSDAGSATFNHDAYFPDNGRLVFGADSDLKIYHDGSNSRILEAGAGFLAIGTNGTDIRFTGNNFSEYMAKFDQNGAATLYHDSLAKIATTSTGIDVSGTALSHEVEIGDGSAGGTSEILFSDNVSARGKIVYDHSSNPETLLLQTTGSTGISIDNAQNVSIPNGDLDVTGTVTAESLGIGISSPLGQLHINTETAEATKVYVDGESNQPKSIEIRHYDASEASGAGRNLFYLKTPASDRLDIGNFTDGSSEAQLMTFLESGNVGIGTVSPDTLAHLAAAGGSTVLRLENTDTGLSDTEVVGKIEFETQDAGGAGVNSYIQAVGQGTGGANKLQFGTGTTNSPATRMTIDADGNVGIGTLVPSQILNLESATDPAILITDTTNTTSLLLRSQNNTSSVGTSSNHPLVFETNATEAARIDTSGKLLIGTTHNSLYNSSTQADAGALIDGVNDNIQVARWEGTPLFVNRMSTEGNLVDFRKDGAAAGSIGIQSNGFYVDGEAGHAGIRFSLGDLVPRQNGADIDATIDLGISSSRFRDLYLSGTAYLPTVDIDSGSIVGCTEVGSAASPISSGEFNTLTVNTNLSVPGTISPSGIVFNDASALSGGRYDQAMTFGNDSDLVIYHDGSHSRIKDKGTGDLFLQGNNLRLTNGDATQTYAQGINGGAIDLRHNNNVKLVTTSTGVTVTGLLTADTKSFTIDHPTKEGMKLRYGSLEGPEHGVYVRGRLNGENTIELPEVWLGLVDADTITVNLTPIGKGECWVEDIQDNTVKVGGHLNCFYMVLAERKDVDKLEVEFPADGS